MSNYYNQSSVELSELQEICRSVTEQNTVRLASHVVKHMPIYDMNLLDMHLHDEAKRQELMSEWAWVLRHGAGVIVLKHAYADTAPIDRASEVFANIIADEKTKGQGKGDHFATSGANDRIWNALQKQCLADPENFAQYFGNLSIQAVSEAWLGPHYQMTAQVNLVRPGGQAQSSHRDYHLGFQTAANAARFPKHVHELTAALTLQGAVAHCDMPIESGPTKLLPFSQLYDAGYLGFHEDDHRAFFEKNYIQLPLEKGDALFFNPALFHGAGSNTSEDIHRMANLLQVSSAFGRAMEVVDRDAMCRAVYPHIVEMDDARAMAAIAACAEGYAFPTNLDTDPPVGGNAPMSQADIMRKARVEKWSQEQFETELSALQNRSKA